MKINIRYLNDDFIVEFKDEIKAGTLLAFLIRAFELEVPILNEYGNQIALQMWSTNYCLDLNQSFEDQSRAISLHRPLGINQTVSCNVEDFNLTINKYLETLDEHNISISKIENKYSEFRNELKKGAAHFVKKITALNLASFINEAYSANNFEKLITDFDPNGLFTRHIMKSRYFMDDKSCDEGPLYAISEIAKLTFEEDAIDYLITMLFNKPLENGISKYTLDKNGKADIAFEQSNELYALNGHSSYVVKLIHQGIEMEEEFEFMMYSLEKRLRFFNALLTKVGRSDRWFVLGNGSCLLTTEKQYSDLLDSNILPPDIDYFNPWEY